ncbi:MAG: serine/threonine protein kinase [Planctomycetaceae bacterium]|nr:serine/threonine protein kinase [Planctomycetaceae bacterium]
MNQISIAEFLDYLRRSRLLDEQRLEVALTTIENELGPEKFTDPESVSEALIAKKLLTPWQVRQLFKRRYKGFYLRQYKILSHLGAGGMSTVYLAEHSLMQRLVAIKVLPKKRLEKSQYLDRFIREAQTIASLDHPNIVRAYDIDHEDDVHYIVMEHFNGTNLQDVIDRDGVLSHEVAADYIRQAALALEYAHQAGVVHRDIKPGNLLVNKEGLVKVLDLGLALLDEHVFEGRLTSVQEDKILGTADYLAPEQGLDSHHVDARADIYGLGGVLYFCLTGHAPFPTGTVAQRLLAHQTSEPQSIFTDRPDAPDDLVQLCQKMMAKNPGNRHQTALDVVADMQDWLISHGFADEADFPPLETLRATPKTLGAVPIPSQEKRLRHLSEEQWLVEQGGTAEELAGKSWGKSGVVGLANDPYPGGGHINLYGSDAGGSDSSTVSGMMRPFQQSQYREQSATSSGQMQKPGRSGTSQKGIIVDDDDIQATPIKKITPEENDPFLFALHELNITGRPPQSVSASFSTSDPASDEKESKTDTVDNPVKDHIRDMIHGSPWYKQVPTWFWFLFAVSVTSTIGLAAALAVILLGRL